MVIGHTGLSIKLAPEKAAHRFNCADMLKFQV